MSQNETPVQACHKTHCVSFYCLFVCCKTRSVQACTKTCCLFFSLEYSCLCSSGLPQPPPCNTKHIRDFCFFLSKLSSLLFHLQLRLLDFVALQYGLHALHHRAGVGVIILVLFIASNIVHIFQQLPISRKEENTRYISPIRFEL